MAFEFKFPDVGEGITEGELLSWKVAEGEAVVEDDTLAEVETDKAVVEIPSPRTGKILKLHAEEGDLIEVGQVIVSIEEGEAAAQPARAEAPPEAAPAAKEPEQASGQARPAAAEEVTPPSPPAPQPSSAPPSEPERPAENAAESEEGEAEAEEFYTGSVVGQLEEAPDEEAAPAQTARTEAAEQPEEGGVLAMPSIRQLAKEMGVDLGKVSGTGPQGRILRQDVEDHAEAAAYGRETVQAPSVQPQEMEQAESWMGGNLQQDEHGVVERVAFKGVRRIMAHRMAESLAKQAQVTTTDEADVSILKRIREKERTLAAERGVRLTYLAFVIKACAVALQRFPRVNAVLAPDCDEFVLKRYYNIGLAIDTKAGLMVPNIKNADRKSIFKIAEEIIDLVERARDRKLDLAALNGGTFTISNYGAIGGINATPATNYPEVAILGMGRVREMPVVIDGQIKIRHMLPLSLTFDHQLIDGAEASRFLNLIIGFLEDPDRLLLESI